MAKSAKQIRRERSPRKARICTVCKSRKFGDLDWECPEHPGKTEDQPDNVYMGQVPQLAEPDE